MCRPQAAGKSRPGGGQIWHQQDCGMGQVCKWATCSAPCRTATLVGRPHAVMCAMDPTAGRQRHLGLTQIKSSGAGNQEQHPAHQQVGNETLHLCSLEHLGLSVCEFAQLRGNRN
jgi:hypothetical protein